MPSSEANVNLLSTVTQVQALANKIGNGREALTDDATFTSLTDKLLQLTECLPSLDMTVLEHRAVEPMVQSSAVTLWNKAVTSQSKGVLSPRQRAMLRHISCQLIFVATGRISKPEVYKKQAMVALKSGRAWMAFAQEKWEEASKYSNAAKDMLLRLPKEAAYLSMLYYNFGVECYGRNLFERAVTWLRESYELGKDHNAVSPRDQARTMRLLASSYLEWDSQKYTELASNAISLANHEYSHASGLYLKLKILLCACGLAADEQHLQTALLECLHHADLSLDLGLGAVELCAKHKRYSLAVLGSKEMQERFSDALGIQRIRTFSVELLIQSGQTEDAETMLKQCITGDQGACTALDDSTRKCFNVIIWDQAAKLFEAQQFADASRWYNYSLELIRTDGQTEKNKPLIVAKLQRNLCSCYISLKDLNKAKSAVDLAHEGDPQCAYTCYLQFKLALLQENTAQGELITNSKDIAVMALEDLVRLSSNTQQVLIALRCLVRLRLAAEDDAGTQTGKIYSYVKEAYDRLSTPGGAGMQNEITWFIKVSWNMGLQSDKDCKSLMQFFSCCCQLCALCPRDTKALLRQKSCMLLCAAASLQISDETCDRDVKKKQLEETLQLVQKCHQICKEIKTADVGKDNTAVLLLLYEFEAQAQLREDAAAMTTLLDRALSHPQADGKLFDTIAGVAVKYGRSVGHREVATRALKAAVRKYLGTPSPDVPRIR
ncbi:PREDICTED: testis-expressed sequence 11 protein-like [Priapulus caudatus]|uniref:Protein ZIP4 homolog n=1 Tax=Priapulus caudatus TaxID=37621 RepID=A0ABM1F0J8_PRICU|nr:PREDICTED: testis-expressed sequence 11 protein-like [Priapulus caudatus]